MAIYRLLKRSAFEPDEVKRLCEAYEEALRLLNITDRSAPVTEVIARKIIVLGQTGERDPARIAARVVLDVRPF